MTLVNARFAVVVGIVIMIHDYYTTVANVPIALECIKSGGEWSTRMIRSGCTRKKARIGQEQSHEMGH